MLKSCCRSLETGYSGESPFARLISLDFYDGPTAGVVECGSCGSSLAFQLLGWDAMQDGRVFLLQYLPTGSFVECERACPGAPAYPSWCPRWHFPDEESRIRAESAIAAIQASAHLPGILVHSTSPLATVESSARLPEGLYGKALKSIEGRESADYRYWISVLEGINGSPRKS
jgi:hypothetical protein